jgi:cytochrome c5
MNMRHALLAALLLTGIVVSKAVLAAAPASVSAGGVTLRSSTADLPFGTATFANAGSDVVNANCLACHSTEMVTAQPNLPEATWKAEVLKMRVVFKAPIDDADVAPIVTYLMQIKGRK